MPRLRLSAEIECFPTWLVDADGILDNVSPASLPVSAELAAALDAWAERWDAIYDMDDPAAAAFPSEREEHRWWADGERLLVRLRTELGPDWTVHRGPAWGAGDGESLPF